MISVALLILWMACLYLIILGGTMLLTPDLARRFLETFAQTSRANLVEAFARLAVGIAFVIAAPVLDHPLIIRVFGAFLAATALLFIVAPGLHRRVATRSVATVAPFMRLIGASSIALGLALSYYLA